MAAISANAGADQTVSTSGINKTVTLDGSASSAGDGRVASPSNWVEAVQGTGGDVFLLLNINRVDEPTYMQIPDAYSNSSGYESALKEDQFSNGFNSFSGTNFDSFESAINGMGHTKANGYKHRWHGAFWYQTQPSWQAGYGFNKTTLRDYYENLFGWVGDNYGDVFTYADVVNEPLRWNGVYRTTQENKAGNPAWIHPTIFNSYDEEYIVNAFQACKAAWPGVVRVINEYDFEEPYGQSPSKAAVFRDLVANVHAQESGLIQAVGMQCHIELSTWNATQKQRLQDEIDYYDSQGIEVHFTEIDCAMDTGESLDKMESELAAAYEDLAELFALNSNVRIFGLWGFYDGQNWRSDDAMPWDSSYNPRSGTYNSTPYDAVEDTQAMLATAVPRDGYAVTIDSYSWKDSEGTEIATGESPEVTLSVADSPHVLTLEITNSEGQTDTDTVTITVEEDVSLSTYTVNKFLDLFLRDTAFTAPTLYLALFTDSVTPGSAGTEVTATGYARQAITFGAASSRSCANDSAEEFNQTSGSLIVVYGYGLYDAPTGGNLVSSNNFSGDPATRNFPTGASNGLQVDVGDITMSFPATADGNGVTDYAANAWLDHLTGNGTISVSTVYTGVFDAAGDPSDSSAGTELSYTGYVRQTSTWDAASSGATTNSAAIVYPDVDGSLTVGAWGAFDAETSGNLWIYFVLATHLTPTTGERIRHVAGELGVDLTTA